MCSGIHWVAENVAACCDYQSQNHNRTFTYVYGVFTHGTGNFYSFDSSPQIPIRTFFGAALKVGMQRRIAVDKHRQKRAFATLIVHGLKITKLHFIELAVQAPAASCSQSDSVERIHIGSICEK